MMRWLLRIMAAVALVWTVFSASPYAALYDLARAVDRRDEAAIEARVNIRALRESVARQIIAAYLGSPAGRDVDPAYRQLAADAATAFAEPILDRLLPPRGLIDLLDDGWPQQVVPAAPAAAGGLRLRSLSQAWGLYRKSESRGFRTMLFAFPPDAPAERRFRLRLRLTNWSWRLADIELPAALLGQLAQELPRGGPGATKRGG
jgi:hypothetical protein